MKVYNVKYSYISYRCFLSLRKIISLILLVFFCTQTSMGQEQKELAKFYVTHATQNKRDITEWALKNRIFTVFYLTDNNLCMANVSENSDEQSWGEIWGLKDETKEEIDTEYKTDIFYFNWNYSNSYDNKTGTCKVQLLKIYKPQGIVSILRMISESLDIIEYTGYMEGSVDFSNF